MKRVLKFVFYWHKFLKYQNKYEVAIKEYQQVLMGGNSSAANKKAAAQGVQDMEKALATNLMKK